MITVADTSPVCYLILIGEVELLPKLFGEILIPSAVAAELDDPRGPATLTAWMSRPPPWLRIRQLSDRPVPPALALLEAGEQDAISLALELQADVVLLDERAGRRAAEQLGLRVTGVLGILEAGSRRGLVDLSRAIDRLSRTSFRVSKRLVQLLLERNR